VRSKRLGNVSVGEDDLRIRVDRRSAGLETAEARYILFFPWDGSGLRGIESGLRWLPLGAQYFVSGRRGR
jgi:hypothetical protein